MEGTPRRRRLCERRDGRPALMIQEKSSLHIAGNMAIHAAIELIKQRGYVITPPNLDESNQ